MRLEHGNIFNGEMIGVKDSSSKCCVENLKIRKFLTYSVSFKFVNFYNFIEIRDALFTVNTSRAPLEDAKLSGQSVAL